MDEYKCAYIHNRQLNLKGEEISFVFKINLWKKNSILWIKKLLALLKILGS